ncbi:MAG: sulfatase [Planctomycetota bacterium]
MRVQTVIGLLVVVSVGILPTGSAASDRPNFLFVIADDWSDGDAGVFGCPWVATPNFDRVATEGVLFRNCFTSNPKCSPCRASILTGRNTWQLGSGAVHFSLFPERGRYPVLTDVLEANGYQLGLTGKGWGPGNYEAAGFDRNPAGPMFRSRTMRSPKGTSAVDYAGNFAEFLKQRDPAKPFFFWLGTHEPHRIYDEGAGVRTGKDIDEVTLPEYYPDDDRAEAIKSDMLDYAVEVEWFDSHLGRAVAELERRGLLDDTVVVVTSDHGRPFPHVKGQIFDEGFSLPLAVRWGSRVAADRVVDDFINVRDFMPTLLTLAGVAVPETVTGRSFVEQLLSEENGWIDDSRDVMLVGKERHDIGRPGMAGYPVRAIRTPEYLFVKNYEPARWPAGHPDTGYRNCDNGPTKSALLDRDDEFYRMSFGFRPGKMLFRIADDPHNVDNLADEPAYSAVAGELESRMEAMLTAEGDPRMFGRGDEFDAFPYFGRKTPKN